MVAVAAAIDRDADRALGEALADLARLVPHADLIHFRNTLKAARDNRQHGTVSLVGEASHGRITDAWVDTHLRAPKGAPV